MFSLRFFQCQNIIPLVDTGEIIAFFCSSPELPCGYCVWEDQEQLRGRNSLSLSLSLAGVLWSEAEPRVVPMYQSKYFVHLLLRYWKFQSKAILEDVSNVLFYTRTGFQTGLMWLHFPWYAHDFGPQCRCHSGGLGKTRNTTVLVVHITHDFRLGNCFDILTWPNNVPHSSNLQPSILLLSFLV